MLTMTTVNSHFLSRSSLPTRFQWSTRRASSDHRLCLEHSLTSMVFINDEGLYVSKKDLYFRVLWRKQFGVEEYHQISSYRALATWMNTECPNDDNGRAIKECYNRLREPRKLPTTGPIECGVSLKN